MLTDLKPTQTTCTIIIMFMLLKIVAMAGSDSWMTDYDAALGCACLQEIALPV